MAARAARNRASAAAMFWLETSTCTSNALNSGSLKISHHAPRSSVSCGSACFHSLFSLNAGGTGAGGVLYLGPTEHAERKMKSNSNEKTGDDLKVPSFPRRGGRDHKENGAKPPHLGADGVVDSGDLVPSLNEPRLRLRAIALALRARLRPSKERGLLLDGAATPPLPRRGISLAPRFLGSATVVLMPVFHPAQARDMAFSIAAATRSDRDTNQ